MPVIKQIMRSPEQQQLLQQLLHRDGFYHPHIQMAIKNGMFGRTHAGLQHSDEAPQLQVLCDGQQGFGL